MAVAITWIGNGGASHDVEVDAEDVESRPGHLTKHPIKNPSEKIMMFGLTYFVDIKKQLF